LSSVIQSLCAAAPRGSPTIL